MSLLWKHDMYAVKGHSHVIGLDEAGRGPLAGPVVVAAVTLNSDFFKLASHRKNTSEFNDSKLLAEERRLELFRWMEKAREQDRLNYASETAEVEEIEQYNVYQATTRAMRRAIEKLPSELQPQPTTDDLPLFQTSGKESVLRPLVLLDGKPMKKLGHPHRAIVKGDSISLAIAMASILAKTLRDKMLIELSNEFPQYGFASHKGYGTPQHIEALLKHGACPQHRPRFLRNLEL